MGKNSVLGIVPIFAYDVESDINDLKNILFLLVKAG